jgi:DNA-binding NarL/FixJ family response regulator
VRWTSTIRRSPRPPSCSASAADSGLASTAVDDQERSGTILALSLERGVRVEPNVREALVRIAREAVGISAAREITSRLPGTKIVMLTISHDQDDLLNALRAGAAGYLPKDIDPARLPPHALHAVYRGEAAIPRALVTRLVSEFRDHGSRRRTIVSEKSHDLTSREWKVLELLRRGAVDGGDRGAAVRLERDRPHARRLAAQGARRARPRRAAPARRALNPVAPSQLKPSGLSSSIGPLAQTLVLDLDLRVGTPHLADSGTLAR